MTEFRYGRYKTLHPCKPECKRRSAECRLTCKDWKVYETKKREEYARRDKEREELDRFWALTAARRAKKRKVKKDVKEGRL